MNETQFKQKIRRILRQEAPRVHQQNVTSLGQSGTPDYWYSGPKADLWVEYKVEPNWLSPAQKYWLDCRYNEGRNVAVVSLTRKGDIRLYLAPEQWGDNYKEVPTQPIQVCIDYILSVVG